MKETAIMGYQYLDMNQYKRKSHFEYFSTLSFPYVGVTVNVDITELKTIVKEKKLPFFLTVCYCIARAANRVPEFRQRIIDHKIAEYEMCRTSHTVSLDDGTYCYCTLDCSQQFQEYLPYAIQAQEDAKEARNLEDDDTDMNELFFISTLPWISYTTMVNPVPIPADSNPRITWGRYFEQDSKILLPVSVLCNHALVDGFHISQFYEFLDQQIHELADVIHLL